MNAHRELEGFGPDRRTHQDPVVDRESHGGGDGEYGHRGGEQDEWAVPMNAIRAWVFPLQVGVST
ncbi:hypothetical protein SALBM135S_06158 [Streptomyces alboniger]